MRGLLKRKFAEVDDSGCSSSSSPPSSLSSPACSEWESDGESSPSDHQDFTPYSPPSPAALPIRSILKKPRLSGSRSRVCFDHVTVFSFPRCQGFTSVPSHGGATLGMRRRHSALHTYTLAEHALERRHRRRARLRERLREERLEALRQKLITSGALDQREAERLTLDQIPAEGGEVHVSDAELEDGGFLQPYSSRQRQALLQTAGLKRIDREEKRQLHILRLSREACGCDCRGFCEPETCACSQAGIKCQVDRFNFPCGCTKDGCGNTEGRVEFNSRRVQTHYIHTAMRLELQRRLQAEDVTVEERREEPEGGTGQAQAHTLQGTQVKSCPFGFSLEEDGLPLTMPPASSFHFVPERLLVEENSCSSDATESSCSSTDSDVGESLTGSPSLPEMDGSLSHALSMCDSSSSSFSTCGQLRLPGGVSKEDAASYSVAADAVGPLTADTFSDDMSRTPPTGYLDENANQARELLDEHSLEGFPHTPSPTLDYSLGHYMDLSLSSDSDLEFFDSDYSSGPLHSSFKLHRHPDSIRHLQLLSSVSLPQYESSTYLLESLIGLTEGSPEQGYAVSGAQVL